MAARTDGNCVVWKVNSEKRSWRCDRRADIEKKKKRKKGNRGKEVKGSKEEEGVGE